MKKAIFVAIISALCLFCTVSASALEPEAIAGATAVAANEAFEATIIGSIKGRAGATAPNGGKGIVFEAYYAAKENVKDIFNGAKTSFTKSSTAKQVDLVKMKDGKVINRLQLKDAPNSADNVLRQVESGKYQQAQLLGTTETAKAYNPKAAAKNLKRTVLIPALRGGGCICNRLGVFSAVRCSPSLVSLSDMI